MWFSPGFYGKNWLVLIISRRNGRDVGLNNLSYLEEGVNGTRIHWEPAHGEVRAKMSWTCPMFSLPDPIPNCSPLNQLDWTGQPGEAFQGSQMCPGAAATSTWGPGCSALIPGKAPPGPILWIRSSPAEDNSKIPYILDAVSILGRNSFPIPVIKQGELEQSLSARSFINTDWDLLQERIKEFHRVQNLGITCPWRSSAPLKDWRLKFSVPSNCWFLPWPAGNVFLPSWRSGMVSPTTHVGMVKQQWTKIQYFCLIFAIIKQKPNFFGTCRRELFNFQHIKNH